MIGFQDPGVLDAVVAGVLIVILPGLSLLQARLINAHFVESIERLPAYTSSMVALALIGLVSAGVGTRAGRGWEAIGLGSVGPDRLGGLATVVAWSCLLLLVAMAVVLVFRQAGIAWGAAEHPIVYRLLPDTHRERWVFAALSVTAGFAEEAAFRGYAIALLSPLFGLTGAVAVSSVVFGLLHAYQGALGMGRTAAVGLVFGVGLLASGSLWPCIVAHAAYDLVAGLWLGPRLMVPGRPSGV